MRCNNRGTKEESMGVTRCDYYPTMAKAKNESRYAAIRRLDTANDESSTDHNIDKIERRPHPG